MLHQKLEALEEVRTLKRQISELSPEERREMLEAAQRETQKLAEEGLEALRALDAVQNLPPFTVSALFLVRKGLRKYQSRALRVRSGRLCAAKISQLTASAYLWSGKFLFATGRAYFWAKNALLAFVAFIFTGQH